MELTLEILQALERHIRSLSTSQPDEPREHLSEAAGHVAEACLNVMRALSKV